MEVFSKPRVNGMADRLNVIPAASLDLTSVDPDDGKTVGLQRGIQTEEGNGHGDQQESSTADRIPTLQNLLKAHELELEKNGSRKEKEDAE